LRRRRLTLEAERTFPTALPSDQQLTNLFFSIALGHPLGATGARQAVTGLAEMRRQKKKVLVTSSKFTPSHPLGNYRGALMQYSVYWNWSRKGCFVD